MVKNETKVRSGIRLSRSDRGYYLFAYLVIGFVLLATIYPLYFVIIASFSNPDQVALGKVIALPKGIQFEGYARIFRNNDIAQSYLNTIFYTVTGTAINLIATMTTAFVFSRRNVPGLRVLLFVVVFTMYFGGGLIPTYFNIKRLGMLGTIWPLLIPGAIGTGNMIIARSYMMSSIPAALDEAAKIDGCRPIRYYFSVVLPLSLPILGVLTLYFAVGHWNSYYSALIYISDRSLFPLQLILREILVQSKMTAEDLASMSDAAIEQAQNYQSIAETMKFSLIVVSSVPMLVLYPFLQRFFVKGVMVGSLKG